MKVPLHLNCKRIFSVFNNNNSSHSPLFSSSSSLLIVTNNTTFRHNFRRQAGSIVSGKLTTRYCSSSNNNKNSKNDTNNNPIITKASSSGTGKTTFLNGHHRTIASKSIQLKKGKNDIIQSALQKPAGPLYNGNLSRDIILSSLNKSNDGNEDDNNDHAITTLIEPGHSEFFIPEVSLHGDDGRKRHRVLV